MSDSKAGEKYILISPVKDEEKYIEATIRTVLKQTLKPFQWIIVDDGSQDRTSSIVDSYAAKVDWIRVLRIDRNGKRGPGSPIIKAFSAGYELVKDSDFDFIVKFDCDLDFNEKYFEELITRFNRDEKLGIASGIYLENHGRGWRPVKMPSYHAAGQTKVVRKKCFEDIGGFVASRGWDTVDEIKAQAAGWKTQHFLDLYFYHLKNEGAGIGFLRTNAMNGEAYYLSGGGVPFFILKFLHRLIFGRPFFLGGLFLLYGFLKPWVARRQRLVNEREAKFYRALLNGRVVNRLPGGLGRRAPGNGN